MNRNRFMILGAAAIFIVVTVILVPLRVDTNKEKKESHYLKTDEETLKLIKTIQVWKLVTDVSLSEEQLVSFLPVFNEQERLRWKFRHDRDNAIERLRNLDKQQNVSEAKLKKAIDDYNTIEKNFAQKMEAINKKLMSKLTTRQQIKYILFQDSYYRELRNTLVKIRELGREEKRPILRKVEPKKDK